MVPGYPPALPEKLPVIPVVTNPSQFRHQHHRIPQSLTTTSKKIHTLDSDMTPRNPTHSPQMQLQTLTKSPPDSKRTIQEWQNSRFTHRSADFNDDGGCTVLRLRCHTSASGHAQPRELARRAVPHATGAAALLQSSHCEIPQDDPSYSRPCIPLISHSLSLPPDPDCVPAALRFLSQLLRLRIRVRQSESGTSECVCV